jgi:hypothetical protein
VSAAAVSPHVRVSFEFSAYPDADYYLVNTSQNANDRSVSISMTPGWFGEGPYTYEQPDLSELDGWDDAFALEDDVPIGVFSAVYGSDGETHRAMEEYSGQLPFSRNWDGLVVFQSQDNTSFTP